MPTAKKLPSESWRCQVYSHTDEIILEDGTNNNIRRYKSFTGDIQEKKGERRAEQMELQIHISNNYATRNITRNSKSTINTVLL